MRKLSIILAPITLFIALAACGVRQTPEPEVEAADGTAPGTTVGTTTDAPATQLTLSILAPDLYTTVIRNAERRMMQDLNRQGVEFNIQLTAYAQEEAIDQRTRLQVMLMAGQGYDLFFWDYHPLRTYAARGFLTDFYTLIDNHPYTNREDFFTNVLQAYEYRGGLYSFPLTFGFEYIGINAALPESITSQFIGRESITVQEMLELHNNLRSQYAEEFDWFRFSNGNSRTLAVPYNVAAVRIPDFIDFDNRIANLTDARFVGFLNEFQQVFGGQGFFDISLRIFNNPIQSVISTIAENHTFINISSHLTPTLALFDHVDPYFLNFIPLADDDGRLIISPRFDQFGHGMITGVGSTWAKLAIPAVGNGELAWEFIQYLSHAMLNDYSLSFGRNSLVTPINRSDAERHIPAVLHGMLVRDFVPMVGLTDGGSRVQAIQNAIAILAELNEKPVAIMEGMNLPSNILVDTFNSFLIGSTTAEATAQEIHNRISLWLIE